MEYYSAVKKKRILPPVTVWMDLESIMLSEISKSEKKNYHLISLTCGDRFTESGLTAGGWDEGGDGRIGQKKRERNLMDVENQVVTAGGGGMTAGRKG